MDPTSNLSNKIQDSTMAAKQRFESFKMGGAAPANSLANYFPKHSHGRSRSRNSSISSLSTLSISASISPPLLSSPAFVNSSTNVPPNGPPPKRPTSHHKRRSSVSTRRESAELMGVSLPDLPSAHSDDNVNFGDRDSIRRRALWALEGKPDVAFSKVEIPDITSPDSTKSFELPTKTSFSSGAGVSGHGINTLMNKHDSFGKLFGSKDQLHTLVEEEEEEEETQEERPCQAAKVIEKTPIIEYASATSTALTKITSRPRPATLNLKPLSLVSAVSSGAGNLPTPTLTPCPKPCGSSDGNVTNSGASSMNRHSVTTASSTSSSTSSSRRPSLSLSSEGPFCDIGRKRSSISYKRSVVSDPRAMGALPSPDSTPISRYFPESNDVGSVSEQPLTATEQHFLFKSHNVLLARIIDLERTLRSRSMSRSRSNSIASDISTNSAEPSDEMLQLIADLKAERDELKRDVDGWRMRLGDADKHATVLARRVEAERREAWVARSRLGLLEIEKNTLEKALDSKNAELEQSISHGEYVKQECNAMREELARLRARLQDADNAVDECIRLRAALEEECARRTELEQLLHNAELLNAPMISHSIGGQAQCSLPSRSCSTRPRGFGFQSIQSIDSDGSSTDVESVDQSFTKTEFTLDVVAEEDEEEDICRFFDGEDGLVGYEDEDDSDLSFQSPGGSSIGSGDELDLSSVSALNETSTQLNSLSKPAASRPSHSSHASLSKTWMFPRGQASVQVKHDDEVDRFFGCLDDDDNTFVLGSEDMNKALFKFGSVDEDEEELPPFVIPSDVGTVVLEYPVSLDAVAEEDGDGDESEADGEDDGEPLGEKVEGGIRFTFNPPTICISPPPAICVSPPSICITPPTEFKPAQVPDLIPVPVYQPFDDEEEENCTFTFPQSRVPEPITPPSSSPATSKSSSRSSSRTTNSPSSIPRAISLRSFSPSTPTCSATPSRDASGRFTSYPATSFFTPPSRKGGATPSFIPQPVSPSPKISTSAKPRVPALRSKTTTNVNDAAPRCYGTSEKVIVARSGPSDTCECPERQGPTLSLSSIMSSPLAARFSFQTLSNLIPLSWSPGATAVASRAPPSTSISSGDDAAEVASLFANASLSGRRSTGWKFVSRDQQLEKLRNRLGGYDNGIEHCHAVNACASCSGADIFL